jgi:hypothetical protein
MRQKSKNKTFFVLIILSIINSFLITGLYSEPNIAVQYDDTNNLKVSKLIR